VLVGKAYMMEPLFNAEGVLRAVAVVDAESGAITMVVPPSHVTFADADSESQSAASPEIS
jgi:hypothetical protein